ncbi:MAG: hypothetical protein JWP94_1808 [Mucilaginibacter sp.]|jgi:hypothetical protein|nr:hypothetical protein [Mucilaginibacter sp.]
MEEYNAVTHSDMSVIAGKAFLIRAGLPNKISGLKLAKLFNWY